MSDEAAARRREIGNEQQQRRLCEAAEPRRRTQRTAAWRAAPKSGETARERKISFDGGLVLFKSSPSLSPLLISSSSLVSTIVITNPSTSPASEDIRERNPKDVNVLVVGSIGYIGKFVVKELVKRGFNVIAIAREQSGIKDKNIKEETLKQLRRANVWFSDLIKIDSLENSLESIGSPIDVVVSCITSRFGGVRDSWNIDY
ncbi:hypothetical protein Scep_005260 [Stephania cephalantha]|uniref:NmrA-like domain-containing protein n=1 Tax=Stephania cephalantha TaxID=152367 RepID=A0AAP0KU75_9MAGN